MFGFVKIIGLDAVLCDDVPVAGIFKIITRGHRDAGSFTDGDLLDGFSP